MHIAACSARAVVFAASAAVTIVLWCGSMSAMPGMEMPGGWTMSMAWMRMPGQSWPGAAATFIGMWSVMMIAMMLPVLVPMLLRYQTRGERRWHPRLGAADHAGGRGATSRMDRCAVSRSIQWASRSRRPRCAYRPLARADAASPLGRGGDDRGPAAVHRLESAPARVLPRRRPARDCGRCAAPRGATACNSASDCVRCCAGLTAVLLASASWICARWRSSPR